MPCILRSSPSRRMESTASNAHSRRDDDSFSPFLLLFVFVFVFLSVQHLEGVRRSHSTHQHAAVKGRRAMATGCARQVRNGRSVKNVE